MYSPASLVQKATFGCPSFKTSSTSSALESRVSSSILMTSCPPSSISIDLPGAEFHGMRSAEAMADAKSSTAHCYWCATTTTLLALNWSQHSTRRGSAGRAPETTCTNTVKYRITLATVADDERVGRI